MSIFLKKCLHFASLNVRSTTNRCIVFVASKKYSTETDKEDSTSGNQKLLRVAVVGVPNAGKSTFINNLINHRVCPTSNKVHTTRRSNKAIFTTDDTQIILFDTPGLVTEKEIKKHHLESSFKSSYRCSIQHADTITVIHDVSNTWTRHELHSTVKDTLNTYPKLPSILVLNKIDVLKSKRILLDLVKNLTNNTLSGKKSSRRIKDSSRNKISDNENENIPENLTGWSGFSQVFMVSSITGDGLSEVMRYLLSQSKPAKWEYPAETYTDETPEQLIVESVRARLLDYLPQEIPYTLKSEIEFFSQEKNTIYASVQVVCPSARIERLMCGESNGKLRQITERVTSDLVETFGKPISLTISTVVQKSAQVRQ